MPKKTEPSPEPPTLLKVPRSEARDVISKRIEKGEELLNRQVMTADAADVLQKDYWDWSAYNTDLLRKISTGESLANELKSYSFGAPEEPRARLKYVRNEIDSENRRLRSIQERLELFAEAADVPSAAPRARGASTSRKVFVVHGHDDAAREGVARFLTKLELEAIILHERPNAGQTIVEKLEKNGDVAFAVVLLTPDDLGGKNGGEQQPRARQNVVLELGYFVGRLGRSRVCALHKGPIELPSDYMGVIYVPLDATEGWKLLLAKELKEAGFQIDLNKAL